MDVLVHEYSPLEEVLSLPRKSLDVQLDSVRFTSNSLQIQLDSLRIQCSDRPSSAEEACARPFFEIHQISSDLLKLSNLLNPLVKSAPLSLNFLKF